MKDNWPFGLLKQKHYGVIYCDPPWKFETWSAKGAGRSADQHYATQKMDFLTALPVRELAADDCVLFMWTCWPVLEAGLRLISAWGFQYKTCAFSWIKANIKQPDMFRDDCDADMGMGYWTRSNSEMCLLASRGKPHRVDAGVRQGIIEPGREHSRKPDCVHLRIERLVAGPYCELFARRRVANWDVWGNETDKFKEIA